MHAIVGKLNKKRNRAIGVSDLSSCDTRRQPTCIEELARRGGMVNLTTFFHLGGDLKYLSISTSTHTHTEQQKIY